ncbi:MAG: hypothetical protein EZS28_045029, partial [Streblomastix strix]
MSKLCGSLDELLTHDQPRESYISPSTTGSTHGVAGSTKSSQSSHQKNITVGGIAIQQQAFVGKTTNKDIIYAAEILKCPPLLFYSLSHWFSKATQPPPKIINGVRVRPVVTSIANNSWLETMSHSELIQYLRKYDELTKLQPPIVIITEKLKDILFYVRYIQNITTHPDEYPEYTGSRNGKIRYIDPLSNYQPKYSIIETVIKAGGELPTHSMDEIDQLEYTVSGTKNNQKEDKKGISDKSDNDWMDSNAISKQDKNPHNLPKPPKFNDFEGEWEQVFTQHLFSQTLSSFTPTNMKGMPTRYPPSKILTVTLPAFVDTLKPWMPSKKQTSSQVSESQNSLPPTAAEQALIDEQLKFQISSSGQDLAANIEVLDLRRIKNVSVVDVTTICCPKLRFIDFRGSQCLTVPAIVRLTR